MQHNIRTIKRFFTLFLMLGCLFFSPGVVSDAWAQTSCTPDTPDNCPAGSSCVDDPSNPGQGAFICQQTSATITPMASVLCDIINWFIYGNLGKGLAILAVGALGVGAVLGKTAWTTAITVAVGIAIMFGAPDVVTAMGIPVVGCSAPDTGDDTGGPWGEACEPECTDDQECINGVCQ